MVVSVMLPNRTSFTVRYSSLVPLQTFFELCFPTGGMYMVYIWAICLR